ncbi:MAG: NAD(+) synthase [Fibrobacterales bacterium]
MTSSALKIAIGQIEVEPGRPDLNFITIEKSVAEAVAKSADIIVFPEFCLSGYLIGDLWEERSFVQDCLTYGDMVRRLSREICIVFGNVAVDEIALGTDGRRMKYNGLYVAYQRKFVRSEKLDLKFQPKTLLPNYREFEENRHFSDLQVLAHTRGTTVADLLEPFVVPFEEAPVRLGCMLCEDGWGDDYSLNLVDILAQKGVDILLNLSSSPFTLGKSDKRDRVFAAHAKRSEVPLLYVNNTGIQNNAKTIYSFDGQSTLYDSEGGTVVKLPAYLSTVFTCSLNMTESYLKIDQKDDEIRSAEIAQSLLYSAEKYMKQCGLKRVVIGVSGGIDSAVAAALYGLIVDSHDLLLVNMPSQYNSQTTKNLARELAENIGCFYTDISIESSVALTEKQINTLTLHAPDGASEVLSLSDFHLENVQARDRSSRILAALSSAFGGVFTCNANKAETTVGYSTLYGDHGGFLALIADLWKEQVYDLGRYLNNEKWGRAIIPEGTFTIVPSAELSDTQDVDADKGDPMVYWYHDRLFHSWMQRWNRVTPEEVLQWYHKGTLNDELNLPYDIKSIFPEVAGFVDDLERWWNLYKGMGVAKRVQAPPVVAVSRRAFGFDYRESLMKPYYTMTYKKLKSRLGLV